MSIDEKNIIIEAQKGNDESFSLLVELFQDRAYAIAFGVMGNSHDAFDMVQESFIKVYKNIKKFNFKSSFNTWLFRIIKNTCIDEIRRKNRKKTISYDATFKNDDSEMSYQFEDENSDIDLIIEKNERKKLIENSISKLNIEHRTVIVLADIKGYNYLEISELLNINIGTVKSRISRGRTKLAEIIRRDGTI